MALPNEIHPFAIAGGGNQYQVANSLRIRSSASAYLSRTPGSTGNQQKATFSFWTKRGDLGTISGNANYLYAVRMTGSQYFWFGFGSSDDFQMGEAVSTVQWNLVTTRKFRDPSAWYHIVVSIDTTQATSSNRVHLYINGVEETSFSTSTYPSLNYTHTYLGSSSYIHSFAWSGNNGVYYGANHYLAEINHVDAQQLDASYFGQTDSITGQWVPKKYSGSYGTNGFYLPFNDATSTTTLGYDRQLGPTDSSKNNWTLNNFTVNSPANTTTYLHDVYIDVPTNWNDGSTYYNRGNYATWNPLNAVQSTLSQGNLRSEATGSSTDVITTFPTSTTGKWYAEISINATPNINWPIRIGAADRIGAVGSASSTYCLLYTDWSGFYIYKSLNGSTSTVAPSGSLPADGDILKIAYDADAGKLWLGLNSGWYGTTGSITGDPATGTDATLSGATNKNIYPNHNNAGGPARVMFLNCGQRPFRYTPPTGFLALNTYNLANPSLPLV